jgi:DNA repair protein RadC
MHPQLIGAKARKPRELLIAKGAKSLSTHELFMVIFGVGTKHVPVHKVAQHVDELLQHTPLSLLSLSALQKIPGLGQSHACRLLAMIELCDRLRAQQSQNFSSPAKIALHLHDLTHAHTEHMVCLYLNARLELELQKTLAIGSLNQAIISPRDIFFPIQQLPISHIVIAHNHPSDTVEPSDADKQFTTRVKDAATLLGITLEDHLVVGKSGWYSFREHGLL